MCSRYVAYVLYLTSRVELVFVSDRFPGPDVDVDGLRGASAVPDEDGSLQIATQPADLADTCELM